MLFGQFAKLGKYDTEVELCRFTIVSIYRVLVRLKTIKFVVSIVNDSFRHYFFLFCWEISAFYKHIKVIFTAFIDISWKHRIGALPSNLRILGARQSFSIKGDPRLRNFVFH